MKKIFILLSIIFCIAACKENKKSEQDFFIGAWEGVIFRNRYKVYQTIYITDNDEFKLTEEGYFCEPAIDSLGYRVFDTIDHILVINGTYSMPHGRYFFILEGKNGYAILKNRNTKQIDTLTREENLSLHYSYKITDSITIKLRLSRTQEWINYHRQ